MYFLFKMKWFLYKFKEAGVNPLERFSDMWTLIEWFLNI